MHRMLNAAVLAAIAMCGAQAALAEDDTNVVFIGQDGADNTGSITQTGALNQLGKEADPAWQSGYLNYLDLVQTGTGNQVGMEGTGLDQDGRASAPPVFNKITIRQDTDHNVVGEIRQSALGTMPEGANLLSVTQQGGNGNRVSTVLQKQSDGMPGQTATLIETGTSNTIQRVEQKSLTQAQNGKNMIRVELVGDGNGGVGLSGMALNSGAPSNAFVQTIGADGLGANGNKIDLIVTGNSHRFGIFQGGRLNSVGRVTIAGDTNQIGIHQDGFENDFTSSVIAGDGNNIGFTQWGTNIAYLDVVGTSNDNRISSFQDGTNDIHIYVDGDRNHVRARQDYNSGLGFNNTATLRVTGSDNFADLDQMGNNSANLTISGDRNNTGALATPQPNLTAGVLHQSGRDNDLSVTIGGDANLFAMQQTGDANAVTLVVAGNANQAQIVQIGADNLVGLRQDGRRNRAIVSQ